MTPSEIERLLWHIKPLCGSANSFEAGFAKSIIKQSSRPGWTPSEKQAAVMERLVSERFMAADDFNPIEDI